MPDNQLPNKNSFENKTSSQPNVAAKSSDFISANSPLLCPIVIGRMRQLEIIQDAIARVKAGTGQIISLAGDAGIGKSRLVSEIRRAGDEQNWQILQGNCLEVIRMLPYAPLIDLLRGGVNNLSTAEISHLLGPGVADLIKLLPELARRLPKVEQPAYTDTDQEKQRLFQAITLIFSQLASQQPLLLVLEDLHWIDPNSLEYLTYLVARLADLPIVLVITCRSEELPPASKRFLAWLERERRSTQLKLERLSRQDVELMLKAIFTLDSPLRPDFLTTIYNFTEGNPFFVEEILKALVAQEPLLFSRNEGEAESFARLQMPATIQDAVERHTENLSASAREILELAAVAGKQFDFSLLERITRLTETELLKAIKELIAAQLVVEVPGGEFAFRHALTRQTIYSKLLIRERKALHHKIARTLEKLNVDQLDKRPEELAYHYYLLEYWPQAISYSIKAGDKAMALFGPQVAVEHYSRALDAAKQGKITVAAPELWLKRGHAWETIGDFELAKADYEATREAARSVANTPTEIIALLALGSLWSARDYQRTNDYYTQALGLARRHDDTLLLAYCLNSLGNWQLNQDEPEQALAYHREALAIFSKLGNRAGMADTYDLMGISSIMNSQLKAGAEFSTKAIELFNESGDRQRIASSQVCLALSCGSYHVPSLNHPLERLVGGLKSGERGLAEARAIGWRSGQAYALFVLGLVQGFYGNYTAAFNSASESLAIAEELNHIEWRTAANFSLGVLQLDLLNFEAARQYLAIALQLATECNSIYWKENAASYLAITLIHLNKPDQAEPLLAAFPVTAPAQSIGQRLVWMAKVELAHATGDLDTALKILDKLSLPFNSNKSEVVPYIALLKFEVLIAKGQRAEANQLVLEAITAAEQQGLLPLQWRLELAHGKLLEKQKQYAPAQEAFGKVRQITEQLANAIPDSILQVSFRDKIEKLLTPARPLSSLQQATKEWDGLTRREREVASLIAQGKSNHEIAEDLVLNQRTVETHIENILSKLDFKSRVQIAAWAIQKGLLQ